MIRAALLLLASTTAHSYHLPVRSGGSYSPQHMVHKLPSGVHNSGVVHAYTRTIECDLQDGAPGCASCTFGVCRTAGLCDGQLMELPDTPVCPHSMRVLEDTTSSVSIEQELLILKLKSWFTGDFDNKMQVDEDRAAGMPPREGGGHEHIHCKVVPVDLSESGCQHALLAHYYFGDDPSSTFRIRFYTFDAAQDPDGSNAVRMQIHYVSKDGMTQLTAGIDDAASKDWSNEDLTMPIADCDVTWRPRGDHFHGTMDTESVTMWSPMMKGPITIQDEVTLWADKLWVNDRGYNADGHQVYGNFLGVPYKLYKVV